MTAHGLVVMAYGTPAGPDDVAAYYTHIRRGRPPSDEQLADLKRRYDAIGGVSPLAQRTRDQARAIAQHLDGWHLALGNKHAAPFVEDAIAELTEAGADLVVGLVLAPHYSRGSVGEYHRRAGERAHELGAAYVGIDSWHQEPRWLDAQAERVAQALAALPASTEAVFTAHSLPERVLEDDPYADELAASAAAIAARASLEPDGWSLGWQSAGRTPEPWRGPDILDVIRDIARAGRAEGVLVCPQGFVSDHLEVLYDLDIDAARVAAEEGLAFARTRSINDEPAVMAALADAALDAAKAHDPR
ncbi:MAG TPA: ferrochelatase [Acidimicrobiales bacterium]|jgi:ferrochelatase